MSEKKEKLKREIGVVSLALAIVNITVGSGIFMIPATIAEGLGATAILTYFVCGLLILLIALCFAEVGSRTDKSGGAYTYIETAFGPYAGFMANNIYWLGGSVISDAAIANALVATLRFFFPVLADQLYSNLLLFGIFGGLAWLNVRSAKNGVRLIVLMSMGKLLPLVVLVIAGISFIAPENLRWEIVPTVSNIGAASLLLFFAFLGLEAPLSNGGEIKDPKRTVPRGVFLGIFLVLLLYISIQLVTQGVLGAGMVAHKDAPLGAVAGVIFGKYGTILIIIAAAVAMLGTLSGEIFSIPRIIFAGARDGLLPKPLAKVHPRFFTPYVSIIFYASLGFLFAISGGFKQLATLASASILLVYLGVVLASIKLRQHKTVETEKAFRMPGGVIIPLLAIVGIIWLLSSLTRPEFIGILIFAGIFSVIYLGMFFIKKNKLVDTTPVQ